MYRRDKEWRMRKGLMGFFKEREKDKEAQKPDINIVSEL